MHNVGFPVRICMEFVDTLGHDMKEHTSLYE